MTLAGGTAYAMPAQANYLYQQACTAEYKEDYKTAVERLTEALSIAPNDVMILTKLAGVYSEMGEYDKALDFYSKVSDLKPTDGYIYVSIGSIYETLGKYKEALDAYTKVMEMCPEYLYNYLNIANVEYQLGDYKNAIEHYNKFLNTYSQHSDARENLAGAYLRNADYENASIQYEKIYAKSPSAFKDYSEYGLALFETKNYEKAVEFLEKAVDADADNTLAHVNLALSYQELKKNDAALAQYEVVFKQKPELYSMRFDYGNLLADMGKNESAIASYKIYIAHYPEDARAYQNIGVAYRRVNDIDNAIKNYAKALELQKDKRDIALVSDLAECYHIKKDYVNALKCYDEVLAKNPDDYDTKYNKALVLHAQKNYKDAISLYNELLEKKDNANIQNNLISAYVAQGDVYKSEKNYTLATEMYEKAIAKNTSDSYVYFALAQCYRACDLNERATEYYEKAISMAPDKIQYSKEFAEFISATNKTETQTDNDSAIKEISLSMDNAKAADEANDDSYKKFVSSGDNNYKSKNYDESIKNYRDALKLKPADEVTLLKLGNIYKIKEDNKTAISYYKKSIVVNPNYADGWFNLGLVYAADKNNNKAKECFHRVITLDPTYGYAYYALGIAYEQDGNKKEALNNYKIYLTQKPDEAVKQTVEQKIKELEQ